MDNLNTLTANFPHYQDKIDEAREAWNQSSMQLTYAEEKLAAISGKTIDDIINEPFEGDYPEFLTLNDHAANVATAREQLQPVIAQRDSAKAELDRAQSAYDAANANFVQASEAQAEAQRIVDNWKDPEKPSTDPTDEKKDDAKKPSTSDKKTDNSKASKKSDGTVNPAGQNSNEPVAEQTEKVTNTASFKTAPAAEKAPSIGIDPIIFWIVGGAVVIAVAAIAAAAIARKRRMAAASSTDTDAE